MSGRRLPEDEVDRLLGEALADDLPPEVEGELRREARRAWRAASEPRRPRWRWLGMPAVRTPALPQPALVAAALTMLGAGAVMQAAPPPPAVVESFEGHEAAALTAQALGRARAMECHVVLDDGRGQRVSCRIEWRVPGETRVRCDGLAGAAERVLRAPGAGSSVLTAPASERGGASLDPALEPVRAHLSPAALGARLASGWRRAPGDAAAQGAEVFDVAPDRGTTRLIVAIDTATHLPVRVNTADRDGRTHAAVCRWR